MYRTGLLPTATAVQKSQLLVLLQAKVTEPHPISSITPTSRIRRIKERRRSDRFYPASGPDVARHDFDEGEASENLTEEITTYGSYDVAGGRTRCGGQLVMRAADSFNQVL